MHEAQQQHTPPSTGRTPGADLAWGWRDKSQATRQASADGYARFSSDRIGGSVHFGLYSIDAQKEWFQALQKIAPQEYAKLQDRFDPIGFDARQWVDLFAAAGATALMVTTKHHDGFCLFDSDLTDFTSTRSPFGRDLIAELAAACHERDIALHLYYSLIDWHHPGAMNHLFEQAPDFPAYCQFMLGQIEELCTRYGPIAGMLFDGWWPASKASDDQTETIERPDWPLTELYDLIHRLQPQCMITNNHHILPLAGEDYQVWELDLPGQNTAGFNCEVVGNKPTMAWITSHDGWSWQRVPPEQFKSAAQVYEMMRQCNAGGSSFFYNVGPRGDGCIDDPEVAVLRELARLRQG